MTLSRIKTLPCEININKPDSISQKLGLSSSSTKRWLAPNQFFSEYSLLNTNSRIRLPQSCRPKTSNFTKSKLHGSRFPWNFPKYPDLLVLGTPQDRSFWQDKSHDRGHSASFSWFTILNMLMLLLNTAAGILGKQGKALPTSFASAIKRI